MEKWIGAKWEKQVQNGICILGIYLVFRYGLPLIYPFVIAGGVGVLLAPVVRKIENVLRIPRRGGHKWSSVICVLLFVSILFAVVGALLLIGCEQSKRLLLSVPFYQVKCQECLRKCCMAVDHFLQWKDGESFGKLGIWMEREGWSSVLQGMSAITGNTLKMLGKSFTVFLSIVIAILATVIIVKDYDAIRASILKQPWGKTAVRIVCNGKRTMFAYLKAQAMVFGINAVICTLTFWLVGQPYFLLLGVFVALFDALPVLGAGAVLLPCALIFLIKGKVHLTIAVLIAYFGCVSFRQLVESKMIGEGVGLSPLCTIFCIYVGYRLFGVLGFILGPLGLLLFREISLQLPIDKESKEGYN